MFKERLRSYRENELKLSTKREMAEKIGVSEQLYAMVERGDRLPSNDFLRKLVLYSNMPEEYWRYGIQSETDLIAKRKQFKSIENTTLELIDEGYITDINFSKDVEDLLITALKADIQHLLLRKNNKD
ncbi:helix-turn-helix domain protein [Clostridium puniceum]|uniref:Helix-turn-helix domain protein n=1 Tax=Clostridium puniceum TaxID=29367 RepID=A0A1S8TW81_9CLOT|nr:helix-turn-helix transcriptional regulator [Clostridium puniceum]OOM81842.1 helix-turn-helix domain protein [Clostridium puniceum]